MATLRELIIKISANSTSFQSEIARASRMGADYHRSMSQGNRQAAAATRESQRALAALNAQLSSTRQAAVAMGGAFAGAFAVGNLICMADSYNSLSARIKLATADSADFAAAQSGLMEISQLTGSRFADNASLFSRAATSLREWGYGTQDILKLTDALATGLQVSGASAEETSSTIVQLSQALSRGVLRGQDFNSVSQSGGRIMKALADGMGVAQKDLKALADEGKLTTDVIVPALISQLGKMRAEFESMPDSVAAASNRINNAFMDWVGGANQSSGATAALSSSMNAIAANIDGVATAAGVLAAVGLARVIGGWSTSMSKASREAIGAARGQLAVAAAQREGLTTSLAQIQSEKASAVAAQQSLAAQMKLAQTERTRNAIRLQMAANSATIIRLNQAEAASAAQLAAVQSRLSVASALAGKALGLVGGPVGAAMLAGGALYYFSQQAQQARDAAIDLADKVKSLNQNMLELSQAQREKEAASLANQVDESEEQISQQKTIIELTKNEIAQLERRVEAWGRLSFAEGELIQKRRQLKIQLGDLEKMEDGRESALKRINQLNSAAIPILESVTSSIKALEQGGKAATEQFDGFGKASEQLSLQLDVSQLSASGAAREAFILAGLQKVAGDAALKHRDDLLALAQGQIMSGAISEEMAAKLQDYAAQLGKLYDNNQASKPKRSSGRVGGGGGKSDAEKMTDTYTRLIKQQEEQIALAGQSTELAKIKYQMTEGELKSLTAIQKQTLMQNAALIDQKKIKEQLRDYEANLADSNASARASNSIDLIGYGEGSRERDRMKEMLQIRQEFEEKNRDLLRQRQAESLDESLYQQEVSLNRKYLNERLADQQAHYIALDKLQNDWQGGVTEGMANWVNEASNYSSQAAAATQSAMTGMVDSIADALNGNKASWKDWTVDVLKSIQKIMVNAALVNGLKSLGGSMSGSGTSWVSSAGSFISGLFDSGGYTGDGGKYEPAGIVHRGEFVFDKESTARFGPENLYRMMKGYASGGLVGSATPLPRAQPVVSSGVSSIPVAAAPQVTVNITSDGNSSVQSAPGYEDFGRDIGQLIQQEYAKLRDRDLRPGGAITRAIKGR